jgi:hypothetical protein
MLLIYTLNPQCAKDLDLGSALDQVITAAEMAAYDRVFAAPISLAVLTAIAALVDRQIPAAVTPATMASVDVACET